MNTTDFLTNEENALPVLEILSYADDIRLKLLCSFWTKLAEATRNRISVSLLGQQMFWQTIARPSEAAAEYAGIRLYVGGSESYRQCLCFSIEQRNLPTWFELYFGLQWKEPVDEAAATYGLAEATALKSVQESRKFVFDSNASWLGWKYFDTWASPHEFLLSVARSPNLINDMAAEFASYVEQTYELVSKVNDAINAQVDPVQVMLRSLRDSS